MTRSIYILNGPNLNLLGLREPEIYGAMTLDDIGTACASHAKNAGFATTFRQSNHEGELVDWLDARWEDFDTWVATNTPEPSGSATGS
ncbi:MAG: type II 3-dehydroquinate dehydratase [Maricaulis sp.]|nr:type II 3-dehydroquinate dehydratase [Maricaulis sp.]